MASMPMNGACIAQSKCGSRIFVASPLPLSSFTTRNVIPMHGERSSYASSQHVGKLYSSSVYSHDTLVHQANVPSCRSLARNGISSDDDSEEVTVSAETREYCAQFASNSFSSLGCNRRNLVFMGTATVALAGAAFAPGGSLVNAIGVQEANVAITAEDASTPIIKEPPTNKETPGPMKSPAPANENKVDITITDKVYMDITMCPSALRSDRKNSPLCNTGEPLGRIVIGLYGRLVPQTVKNFKAMMTGAAGTSYAGTIFHRVLAGQYIQGGRQGAKEKGEVSGLLRLTRNQETVSSKSYKLGHSRPGTVSLALAENDDDEDFKLDVDYHNVQFLITTGPGPAPQLDNGNIVIGTVMEGLDVVAAVAKVPTYRPNERIREFNNFAAFLGDERAANARNFWDRPLKSVVISACGELQLGFPVFPPGLP